MANSGFNWPGIHPNKQGQPAGDLEVGQGLTCLGQENINGVPVEGFTKSASTTAGDDDLGMVPRNTGQHEAAGASAGSKELNQTLLPNHFQLKRKGSDGLEQPGEVEAILSFLQGSRVSKLPSLLCEPPGPHK